MNSVKQMERFAPPLTILLCLGCLAGLWALMTLPSSSLWQVQATMFSTKENIVFSDESLRAQQLRRTINDASYPIPEWAPAHKLSINPALVYAIIKQESGFKVDARSPAGARGVMQIMPDTAEYMIKHYRLNEIKLASSQPSQLTLPRSISSRNLNDPAVNLLIGQHYIQYLNDKSYIDGELIYLLTAYNAGPGNLIRWQKQFGHLGPSEFARHIPFKETRNYVRKVMANYRAYHIKLHGRLPHPSHL